MANPATLLYNLLADWSEVPRGLAPENVRGDGNANAIEFWHMHGRAVGHLRDIERALDGMEAVGEDVDHYREGLPELYQAVFAFKAPWNHAADTARQLIGKGDLRLLKALAGQLSSINYCPPVTGNQIADLLASLNEIDTLIRESTDISIEIRRYLLGLVGEARRVTSELNTFGDVELRTITFELGAALLEVADESIPEEKRKPWLTGAKAMVRRVSWQVAEKALESGADAALDAALGSLGG